MNFDYMLIYEVVWLGMGIFFAGYLIYQWIKKRKNRQIDK